jgi:hypothetical protein
MAIYTPEDIANLVPTTIPEAVAKAGYAFVCRSAPVLAGYAFLTGNLPAYAGAGAISVACGLPLIPLPDPLVPLRRPFLGGERPIQYRYQSYRYSSDGGCNKNPVDFRQGVVTGPVRRIDVVLSSQPVSCRPTNINLVGVGLEQAAGLPGVGLGAIFPDLGDYVSITLTPLDGSQDSPDYPSPIPYPLPPGVELPPGWPDAPRIPGGGGNQPIYDPDNPTQQPREWLPWKVLPIPLPIFVQPTLSVPINAPISIPISIPVSISPQIDAPITIQLDPDGNIRTPPDLICECPKGDDGEGPITLPTSVLEIPYFACSPTPAFQTVDVTVVSSSVPADLLDKLLSSANLAELGCECTNPEQKPASRLSSGRSGALIVAPQYSEELPPEVVSVEIRLSDYSQDDYRELSTFPGAGQRKFGAIAYCLLGSDGGADQVYLWDENTYYRLPNRLKPARLKVILRPGISWEVWDTGERQ